MTITHTDYLVAAGVPGLWVRLLNNSTATNYYSTAATDANGAFTHSAPPGDYALYTGSAATVVGTPTLRNAHYPVPVTAGDDVAANSYTATSSPYAPGSKIAAGAVGIVGGAPHGLLYDLGDTIVHYDNFQRANGLIGTSLSGDVYTATGSYLPTITSNKYTIVWSGSSGSSYAQMDNGVQPYQMGASYTFGAGSTDAVLGMVNTPDSGLTLQNLVHFIHSTTSWSMQYRIAGGTITTLKTGVFDPPLVADGVTEYTTTITYAPATNTVYLFLPDGSTASVTSAFFAGLFGRYCFWEPTINLATDKVPQFTAAWMVTRRSGSLPPPHASTGDIAKALGDSPLTVKGIELNGSLTVTSGAAVYGIYDHPTLIAAANNDTLYGLQVNPTWNDNGKTGVAHYSIYVVQGSTFIGGSLVPASNMNYAGGGAFQIQYGGVDALYVLSGGGLRALHQFERSRQTPTEAVLVSGVDATAGELVGITITAARVVGAPLNAAIGQRLTFNLVQGGAGAFAITWNAVFKGITGGTSGATGTRASFSFDYDGTSWNLNGAQPTWVA